MLVQKTQKVIDPPASADAVLSHCLPQQVDDFTATEFNAFDQAHDHPHVGQHRRTGQTRLVQHHPFQSHLDRHGQWVAGGPARRRSLRIEIRLRLRGRRNLAALAAAIEAFLLLPSDGRLIVGGTPLAGTLPPVMLPAAERTTQVPPTSVAGMRKEPNPAVRAVSDAAAKLGMGLQDRVQRGLILPDKRPGAIVLVPIRAKREKLLDGYGKKARLSVTMRMLLDTPSSYPLDANASRGGARFFLRQRQRSARTIRTNGPLPIVPPAHPVCRAGADSLRVRSCKHYLERRKPSSSFQVVGNLPEQR